MMKVASETRMFRRYQVISLRLTGKTLFETAGIVGIARKTVDNYWAAYKKGGMEAFTPKKQPGAEKKMTGQQEEEILDMIVNHTPVDYGFPVSYNWT